MIMATRFGTADPISAGPGGRRADTIPDAPPFKGGGRGLISAAAGDGIRHRSAAVIASECERNIPDMKSLLKATWSFPFAGAVFALIFCLALYLLDTPAGMTNAYIMLAKYCEETASGGELRETIPFDWQTGVLLGIFIGAFAAAVLGGEWKFALFPEDRENKKFIPSLLATPINGFGGGFLVMLGLQLAGDSLIGQWAAAAQLATGAWIFFSAVLLFGLASAAVMGKASGAGGK